MSTSIITIAVRYERKVKVFKLCQNDFFKAVYEKFGVKEDEIEIVDLKKRKIIDVDELGDLDSVEIRKCDMHANDRSHSKEVDIQKISQKLLDNNLLTAPERLHIIEILENMDYPPAKRRKMEVSEKPKMKNRKLQVDVASPIATTDDATQTEEVINCKPSHTSTLTTEDLVLQCKKLTASKIIDAAIANDLMSKSFKKRRKFILKNSPIAAFVKEKYPLLFSTPEVRNELDRIIYAGKCADFLGNIEKYSEHILSLSGAYNTFFQTIKEKMNESKTAEQKKYAQDVGALLLISPLVLEERHYLKTIDKEGHPGNCPHIVCQAKEDDLYFVKHLFKIIVEGTVLCETYDFKEAILCLVAGYFIFNISYPKKNYNTFVTFEKLFLESKETAVDDIDVQIQQIYKCVPFLYKKKAGFRG